MTAGTEWDRWWKSRGQRDLTLLLWAVWNPIGTCPLDEYEKYGPTVAGVLRKAHELDAELTEQSVDDEVQLMRNALATETVELLSTVLAKLRTTGMGLPPDQPADKRAASILFDWHEWAMQGPAAPD